MQFHHNLSFHKLVLDPSNLRISANLRVPSNISHFEWFQKRLDLGQIIWAIYDPKLGFGREKPSEVAIYSMALPSGKFVLPVVFLNIDFFYEAACYQAPFSLSMLVTPSVVNRASGSLNVKPAFASNELLSVLASLCQTPNAIFT